MKPAHVRLLAATHAWDYSGAPLALFRVLARLKKGWGWNPVVAGFGSGPLARDYQYAGIRTLELGKDIGSYHAARHLVANADLVLANTLLSWQWSREAQERKVPDLLYVHEGRAGITWVEKNLVPREVLTHAAGMAHASRWSRDLYTNVVGPARKTYLVPYGVDPEVGGGRVRRHPNGKVLMLGSVEARKGQDVVLAAWDRLGTELDGPAHLTIAGRVLDTQYRRILSRREGTHFPVRFRPPVHWKHVPSLLSRHDVLVLGSRDEVMPLVILEAMRQGVLVIAPALGGIPEVVEHNLNGILYPAGDDANLASKLAWALTFPAVAKGLAFRGQADQNNHHDLADQAELLHRALTETLA